MNADKLLELAKGILSVNSPKWVALTGSLALKMHGYELRREPHDIDFVYCGPQQSICLNDLAEYVQTLDETGNEVYPDFVCFKADIDGEEVKIDFLYSKEFFESINGYSVCSAENVIKAKEAFANQGKPSSEKHRLDVEFLKGQTPSPKIIDYCDDLPF